ncbi:MAG TPA: serine/threonine-protein kinase [Gemmata sp.]|nr:serine/threonine-protein kinase [Gemmata sp.]
MPDAHQLSPSAEAPPPPDLSGKVLGDYQLLRRLGVGGMGQVYLARQLSLKREVALKLLRDDLATNSTALKRFQAEAEAVARLNHPNIVHIHQIGEHDGLRYMALEYVEGRNLRDYLARKGPPELAVALGVIRQVALALQKAHELGIVHRDIKPENILVTRKAEVKVADFGLSRFFAATAAPASLTQSGVALGTPLYMAPEQVQGQPTDQRTDIYSLGATCYHLLAGEPPFRGATAFDVAVKHVQEHPRPLAELCPDLPPDLCAMVHKMMAKDPADRYPSIREVLHDLAKVRDGAALDLPEPAALSLPPPTPAPLAAPPAAPATPRVGPAWWGLPAVACGLATAAGAALYAALNPPPEPPPPRESPPAGPGLAEVRPPEKLVAARERELVALLANRQTPPDALLRGSIELGLLFVRDRRLDEARDRFAALEKEQFPPTLPPRKGDDFVAARFAGAAGRLGQAVVLAHRDRPDAARQSNDLIAAVADQPFPRAGKFDKLDKSDRGVTVVIEFLLRHPDLGEAVADAIHRNAATLGNAPPLTPPALEQLRTPPRAGKKK